MRSSRGKCPASGSALCLSWINNAGAITACLVTLMLSACASLSPEQCKVADWRQIGFSDGASGASAERINDHAKACAKYGVRPQLDDYLRGREQGLQRYCRPDNGFTVGRRGSEANASDCPENLKYAFLEQYRRGSKIHVLEQDLAQRRERIERNQRQIRRNDEQISKIRRELDRDNPSPEKRTALLNDYNRLLDQKNSLSRELPYLHSEAQRVQMHVQMRLRDFGH